MAQQFGPHVSTDIAKLKPQITIIKDMVRGVKPTVQTPEDVMQLLWPMRTAFPDATQFIQLVLTLPVSSAQAGRPFSCLKHVKTYLRSTMCEQRLNNLPVLLLLIYDSGYIWHEPVLTYAIRVVI